jgi:transglutaminase-like putative cysteine protease
MTPSQSAWFRTIAFLLSAIPTLVSAQTQTSFEEYEIGAPAEWVDVEVPIPTALEDAVESQGSVEYLLVDRQLRIHERGSSYYTHLAQHILNEAGVKDESNVQIDFDPQSEKITLHTLEVRRAGQTIEQLARARISVLRRESSLEDGILDGSLTMSILLEDIRPGDTIVYSYTRDHFEEALGNRFFTTFMTQWSTPVKLSAIRLLHPDDRTIEISQRGNELEPKTQTRDGWRESRWVWRNLAGIASESDRPAWYEHYPKLELSEYASWAEVVEWARPLYRLNRASADMRRLVEGWVKESSSEADRIISALRFVQDDVRYTGLEIGSGAYRPTSPALVIQRRFGDCKDKSLLLIALLDEMGIGAHPALVSTDRLQGITRSLPSPGAFDHAIVRVLSGGQKYWLDATRRLQGGTLETIEQGRYGAALVVAEGVVDLEQIPQAHLLRPSTEAFESFDLSAGTTGTGIMKVTTTYRGGDADGMRRSRQAATPEETARRYLNFYRKWYPGIRATAPISHIDDRRENILIVTEAYEIEPAFAKQDDGSLLFEINSHVVDDEAIAPGLTTRTTPLALRFPTHVTHRTEVKLPEQWNVEANDSEISGPGFEYRSNLEYADNRFEARYDFKTLTDHIDAKDAPEYARKVRNVRDDTYYQFTYGASSSSQAPSGGISFGMLGSILFGVLASGALLWVSCEQIPGLPRSQRGTAPPLA